MSSTDPRPQGWEIIPLRYVCELNPSVSFDGLDEDEDLTFLPMDRVKSGYFIPNTDKFSKYGSSYTAFEDGDIVLAKVTPCFENGNIAIAGDLVGGKGFGSSELFVIRPTAAERRFLFYYFQSSIFKQDGEASMTGAGDRSPKGWEFNSHPSPYARAGQDRSVAGMVISGCRSRPPCAILHAQKCVLAHASGSIERRDFTPLPVMDRG